jgi:hypothetical protein
MEFDPLHLGAAPLLIEIYGRNGEGANRRTYFCDLSFSPAPGLNRLSPNRRGVADRRVHIYRSAIVFGFREEFIAVGRWKSDSFHRCPFLF